MQVQQKSYTQKFQQQSYNKLSSLTTYYSSKLINKTIILFVLSPLLFKKNVFPFSFSFFPLFSVVSPYHRFSLSEFFFFSLLLLYFLLLSSGPFLSSSSFFLFFFPLFSYPLFSAFFFFLFSPLSSHRFSFPFTSGSWWWWIMDRD